MMPFFKELTDHADIADILLNDQRRFSGVGRFAHDVMRGRSRLTIAERELIAAFVSYTNECAYCVGVHTQVANNFGVSAGVLESLAQDIDSAPVDSRLRPMLHFARKLTLTPSMMTEQDAQSVFDAGWSEDALYDLICVASLFNFYNRLLDGHGIKGHDNLFAHTSAHLSRRGYKLPWFLRFLGGSLLRAKERLFWDA